MSDRVLRKRRALTDISNNVNNGNHANADRKNGTSSNPVDVENVTRPKKAVSGCIFESKI
jgi:hypothetical protein